MKGFSNFPENFCVEWVQMRKYLACVFYMPILLRICRSESTHETPNFLGNYDFFKKSTPTIAAALPQITVDTPFIIML